MWLKAIPKQPSSIKETLIEITQALEILQVKKQSVFDHEVSLEYPRESRVELYSQQISIIKSVLELTQKAVKQLGKYPHEIEKTI